ncbi:MAG: phytanoyl-CoA dioxygenase family protein [Planctomycetes bacterium]|nr:phytanoyl-CoA dioxygenase family protein [Planctomycetota bacterium]
MSSAACSLLTAAQMTQFKEEGYVVVDDVFSASDLQPVIDEVAAEVDRRSRELVAEGKLSRDYAELDFERRLAAISLETPEVARSIWNGTLAGPAFFHLITHPRLLDVAEQFCGPEIIASSVYRLRPKIPQHEYGAVPWHQDSGYMEPYCDKATVLTVWLPLVDANEENGCLWVLPKAHRGEVVPHHRRTNKPYLIIVDENLPDGQPKCVPVRKGGVLLLHNRTPHASFENKTNRVRWSMDLRYQSAALPTNAKITRLPNEDVADGKNGVPIACYPPEADFLVRSQARPNEVVTEPAVFHKLRKTHQSSGMTNRWAENVTER